jgi:hypothetical protein
MKRRRNVRDIPWQQALLLICGGLLIQALNVVIFSGDVQLIITIGIGIALLVVLRVLMGREYRRFASSRDSAT